MVLFLRKNDLMLRFFVWLPVEVVEITNWGARMPQKKRLGGGDYPCIKDFLHSPPPGIVERINVISVLPV